LIESKLKNEGDVQQSCLWEQSTAWLQELIQIESVSENEQKIIVFLQEKIASFQIPELVCERIGDNLVVEYRVDEEAETLGLLAHVDTVPLEAEKWKRKPLGGEIEEGRIYGRGATDVKNGAAMFLAMIENLRYKQPQKNLKFVFFSREEKGTPNGLTEILETGRLDDLDCAVVVEPTNRELVVGCCGVIAAEFDVLGQACHSSEPGDSENAIENFAKLVLTIREQVRDKISTQIFGDLDIEEVLKITTVETDNSVNTAPGVVRVGASYRYSPDKSFREAEEYVRKAIESVGVPIDNFVIEHHDVGCDPIRLPAEIEGLDLPPAFVRFWTDIAQLQARGIPVFNLGPGSIKQAHVPDESLELNELNFVLQKLYRMVFAK
jgi:succinyl-diaminopimelate desuccinylase